MRPTANPRAAIRDRDRPPLKRAVPEPRCFFFLLISRNLNYQHYLHWPRDLFHFAFYPKMATQSTSEQADNPPDYDSIQPRRAAIHCIRTPAAPERKPISYDSPRLLPVTNATFLSTERLRKRNPASPFFTYLTTHDSPRHSKSTGRSM